MDKFWQSLSYLLPPGWAFPRDLKSVVMRCLKAFGSVLKKHEDDVHKTVFDWMPHHTVNRLDDWEDALGLPDTCFSEDQSLEIRHTNMLARFRGDIDLQYDDSSADGVGSIVQYMKRYGYEIEVWYNIPFRVARNHVGDSLGALNGILHVRVLHVATPFRVSHGRIGQRLIAYSKNTSEIVCLLRRIVASRFEINVIFN